MIKEYDVKVITPPCEPRPERYAARAHLTGDISEVLPYLNATLRSAVYLPAANALTWKNAASRPTPPSRLNWLRRKTNQLAACPPFVGPQYAGNLAALEALLIDAPAIG